MRHLLLALMIALLPLRAWAGDAMAISMLGHPAATAAAAGFAAEHANCPDHAAQSPPGSITGHAVDHSTHATGKHVAEASHAGQDHHQHNACDVCNGPVLGTAQPGAATPAQLHAVLALSAERFASFAPQQGVKPPIS
ncbi:MAG: hypothetical protein U1D25_03160 [Hydrogenophaga sp.]|uniref:hypothetical protein n=1 Tax=Hydrogenophaga sp. TaxID=1904254 RepID=UPI0027697B03|nr:hypothetical protein [Hydrogenophaga sp.]MDP2418019.1 hypothetical protein [Hydrogenophaga sp.]MDZ4187098.1 hypothetical protein [Hydrogenophaga sp.]